MALDPISVVNLSLGFLSVEPIQSWEEEFAGTSASAIYASTVGFCLGIYPFSFGQEMRVLSRLSETSKFGTTYVFQLPSDRLGPPLRITDSASDPSRQFLDYVLSADQAHANCTALYALVKFMADPARWSATFAHAVELALAGHLAFALADDSKERDNFLYLAYGSEQDKFRGGAMGAAIAEDARAMPPRRLPYGRDPFTQAHAS